MGRMIYTDGRTDLTTTAFRYRLRSPDGTLLKDWTTGVVWTEEPAGTYSLDDDDAVPGTVYAVEPATGEVGGVGMVDWGEPAHEGDAMTLTPAYDHAKDDVLTPLAEVDAKVDAILAEDVGADLGTDTCTITLHDASGGVVADARVYVSSDADGLVRSDIRVTDALGQVRFDLTDGETYYLWAFSTRVSFTNPIQFVAVAD